MVTETDELGHPSYTAEEEAERMVSISVALMEQNKFLKNILINRYNPDLTAVDKTPTEERLWQLKKILDDLLPTLSNGLTLLYSSYPGRLLN